MLAILNLLNMGGGSGILATDENSIHVDFEDTTLHAIRGSYDLKTIYVDRNASQRKRVSVDWTRWLDGSTISSVAWDVENTSNAITLSGDTFNNQIAVNHVNSNDSAYGLDLHLRCTITTADSPTQTESRSFLIRTVRTH